MNPYFILGLTNPCSEDELKKRYHELAQIHHPDKGGSEESFKRISDAYKIIASQISSKPKPDIEAGLTPCNPDDLKQIVASFSVSVADIKNGKQIPVSYLRRYLCMVCKGDHNFKGSVFAKCSSCMGKGFFERAHHITIQVQEIT